MIVGLTPLCETAVYNRRFDDKYICLTISQSFLMSKFDFEIEFIQCHVPVFFD